VPFCLQPCDTARASHHHRPMPNGSLALLFILLALVGCTDPNKPNLEVACALTKCKCLSDRDGGYFERNFRGQRKITTAVLWTERGNAYCPEGYSLRRVDESRKMQYYTPPSKRELPQDGRAGQ
jgi:hypothetical protein